MNQFDWPITQKNETMEAPQDRRFYFKVVCWMWTFWEKKCLMWCWTYQNYYLRLLISGVTLLHYLWLMFNSFQIMGTTPFFHRLFLGIKRVYTWERAHLLIIVPSPGIMCWRHGAPIALENLYDPSCGN
jgi:hypothetical protein